MKPKNNKQSEDGEQAFSAVESEGSDEQELWNSGEQECPECLCAFDKDESICPNCGLELEAENGKQTDE